MFSIGPLAKSSCCSGGLCSISCSFALRFLLVFLIWLITRWGTGSRCALIERASFSASATANLNLLSSCVSAGVSSFANWGPLIKSSAFSSIFCSWVLVSSAIVERIAWSFLVGLITWFSLKVIISSEPSSCKAKVPSSCFITTPFLMTTLFSITSAIDFFV